MFIRQSLRNFLIKGKLWLPLFLCFNAFAEDLAQTAAWKNLLHFDGHESLIDSPVFFLSPNGSLSPAAELELNLSAVNDGKSYGRLKQPYHCAYPARMKFLKNYLNLEEPSACPELETWLKGLHPQTLSLIFASYYPNNPASIFGHTFLKINSGPENKISDYAINYLAITPETNGLIFGLKGLFGMYRGQFSILPYFLKVNEYNHSESRDLFEYELNFTQDEIDTLLRHVWELENNGHFDYYFVDENCSYFLMRLLDVARPGLNLSEKFSFEVLPAETIKAVYQAGISQKPIYRPSLYTELDERMQSQPENIDTRIMLKQFKKLAEKKFDKNDAKEYHQLLVERSKLASPKIEAKLLPRSFPHETHAAKTLSVGAGLIEDKAFSRFTVSPGLHNLLDSEAGYLPFSAVELLKLGFRIFDSKQIFIDQVTLIDVATLNPHKSWSPKFSWKSQIEFKRFDQDLCDGCKVNRISTALGKSFLFDNLHLFSVFLGGQFVYSNEFSRKISYGLNPELTYNFAGRRTNFDTRLVLLTRLDEEDNLDSVKISQGVGFKLGQNRSLRFKGQYYAPLSERQASRYETMLEWVSYY